MCRYCCVQIGDTFPCPTLCPGEKTGGEIEGSPVTTHMVIIHLKCVSTFVVKFKKLL